MELRRVGPAAYRVHFEGDAGRPCSQLDLLNDEAAMAAQLERAELGAGAAAPSPAPRLVLSHAAARGRLWPVQQAPHQSIIRDN